MDTRELATLAKLPRGMHADDREARRIAKIIRMTVASMVEADSIIRELGLDT